jgi:TonB family protein
MAVSMGLGACAQVKPAHQGVTSVLVSVRADGAVVDATVMHSAGDSTLDQGAVDAMKRWPFNTATIEGVGQDSLLRIPIALNVPMQLGLECSPTLRVVGTGLQGDNPGDRAHTIYLTVLTDGCASSTLSATWHYDGPAVKSQLVNETRLSVVTGGPATTIFRVKNPQLWPIGSYHVDVEVNDSVVATRHFVIDGEGLSVAD